MSKIKKIGTIFGEFGINPLRIVKAILGVPTYFLNLCKVLYQNNNNRDWKIALFPVFADRYENSGVANSQYFYMDLWAARIVKKIGPLKLVDVGSRVDGYIAHILTFREVEVFDVRKLESNVDGLSFRQIDLSEINSTPIAYADCVSSLHALEHFGLGRYGDKLDLDGWKIGLMNMVRMLKPNGNLILAVPVGRQRIEFDAHRVFSPETIVNEASKLGLKLESYSYVDDNKVFHHDANPISRCLMLNYGCGCFCFSLEEKFNV